jgi:hypothetical protein
MVCSKIRAIVRPFFQGGSIMNKKPCGALCFKAGLTVLLSLILSSPPVWADRDQQVSTVYAVGSSSIRAADMSAGRNEAIADSLVVAVTHVLNDLMPPETMEGNFQVLSESILSRTDQFILDYKMLTEATHAHTHRVMVKVTVSVQRLKDSLKQSGIYIGEKKYPKILFCIAEKQVGDVGYQYWWNGQSVWRAGAATEVVTKISKDKGFVIVTPRMGQSMTAYPPELSVPEAVALAQQLQAEVVVVGQAVAEETSNTMGASLRSFRGTVAARAFSVRNGQEIGQTQHVATTTGDDPESGGREAINNAALSAGEELASQVAAAWFSKGVGSSKIEIQVEGISGHIADFVKFRGAVGVMSGVDSVQRKEMQADTAVLLVDYQGSARALADALMRQGFDTFGLNIAEPEGNTIRLQIVPR